jgi:hypothetical protein
MSNRGKKMRQKILRALENATFEEDPSQSLLHLLEENGWDQNLPILLELLNNKNQMKNWPQIIITLWYGIGKRYLFPIDYTIAVLYHCLDISEELDENLIWSITRNLKNISYESDYDPYQDENVQKIMQKL